jgi:hypothetical protein
MANLAPVTIGKQEDVAKLDELEEQMQGLVKRAKSFDVRDDDSRDSAVDGSGRQLGITTRAYRRKRKVSWTRQTRQSKSLRVRSQPTAKRWKR